jgi:hypothetical protein
MAEDIKSIAEHAHHLAQSMEDSNKHATTLSDSFRNMALSMATIRGAEIAFKNIVAHSKTIQALHRATSVERLDQMKLLETRQQLWDARQKAAQEIRAYGANAERERALDFYRKEMSVNAAQLEFAKTVSAVGKFNIALFAASVALAGDLLIKNRQLNQDLIEANSSYQHRYSLIYDTLNTQVALGASFEKVTNAARALVHYNMDAEQSFAENLRIVTQMEQGLGASVDASARLASVVERQVGGSFKQVANIIAQLVNDTALAADEAVRMADAVTQAVGRLAPGGGSLLPDVIRLIGRYEGALKEVGGQPGGIQQFLTKLTTTEGIVGAGVLRVNPEFLRTERGVEMVMNRFAEFGDRFIGQTSGWERQFKLDALAQMFGVSAEQANQMLIASRRLHQQQTQAISLQERWRQQVSAIDKGFERLTNTVIALAQRALYPVIWVVGGVINRIADFVEMMMEHKWAVYTATAVIGAGLLAVTASMYNLAASLVTVILTSNAATAATSRLAAAMALRTGGGLTGWLMGTGTTAGGIGGLRLLMVPLTSIATALGVSVGFLAAIAAAVAAAGVVLYLIHRENVKIREEGERRRLILQQADMNRAREVLRLQTASRYGTADDYALYRKKLFTNDLGTISDKDLEGKYVMSAADRAAKIAKWEEDAKTVLPLMAGQGVLQRGIFKTLKEQTPEEQAQATAILNQAKMSHRVFEQQFAEIKRQTELDLAEQHEQEIREAKAAAAAEEATQRGSALRWGHGIR